MSEATPDGVDFRRGNSHTSIFGQYFLSSNIELSSPVNAFNIAAPTPALREMPPSQ